MSEPYVHPCVMPGCPIPWECERVGVCYEACRADERARYEADERAYYAEQEAAYQEAMMGASRRGAGMALEERPAVR